LEKFDNRFGISKQLKKHWAPAGTIHNQLR